MKNSFKQIDNLTEDYTEGFSENRAKNLNDNIQANYSQNQAVRDSAAKQEHRRNIKNKLAVFSAIGALAVVGHMGLKKQDEQFSTVDKNNATLANQVAKQTEENKRSTEIQGLADNAKKQQAVTEEKRLDKINQGIEDQQESQIEATKAGQQSNAPRNEVE